MWFSMIFFFFFFFKQKTAYEMRISDWSSDVCSSDLEGPGREPLDMARDLDRVAAAAEEEAERGAVEREQQRDQYSGHAEVDRHAAVRDRPDAIPAVGADILRHHRADRGADRERGHLDIVPPLQRSERRRVGKKWVNK